MDGLTFLSNTISALAWPASTLLLVVLLLRRAPQLSRFIRTIRYKDIELTLREDFLEASRAAEVVRQESPPQAPSSVVDRSDKLLRVAEIDPALAIVEVWKRLEAEIISLMQHNGAMRFFTPARFVEFLGKKGKITQNELALFQKLRQVRNSSVHAHRSPTLTLAEVLEFSDFVDLLARKFDELKQAGYLDLELGDRPGP